MMMAFMGFNTVSGRHSGVGHGEKRHDNTNTPGRLLNEYAYMSDTPLYRHILALNHPFAGSDSLRSCAVNLLCL